MNNYDQMLLAAQRRFLEYDPATLAARSGVRDMGDGFALQFLGREAVISKKTGQILVEGDPAGFSETLSILDWLCDAKPDAVAAGEFCTVSSLPGVYVRGSGLDMGDAILAEKIHYAPDRFRQRCLEMGGTLVPLGDLGVRLPVFYGVDLCLKFYFGDEEFAPSLNFLWDRNILQFVRYETVYYIAGCLQSYLRNKLGHE